MADFDTALMGTFGWTTFIVRTSQAGIADDGDILMSYDPINGGKIFSEAGDLVRDKGLRTSVLISLLTDRIAEDTDILPDNTGALRGWWADSTMGSRLWLLFRASLTTDVPAKIEQFAKESLEWMITEGVAENVIVTAERTDVYRIDWLIEIIKPGQKDSSIFKFFFNWENEVFGEAF